MEYKAAYDEWLSKTQWVQDTVKAGELGRHRADVLRMRIEALEAQVYSLRHIARQALPFVAYAWTHNIDGSLQVGRDIEQAIGESKERWSGWCTQYPGKMPVLRGAKEIAELNYYPEEGMRMFFMAEVPNG